MIRAALGALVATVLLAPPPPKPLPRPPPKPSAPIPALPVVTRVRVEAGREATVVTEEVTFAKGEWLSGDIDAYVAFGGPGVPRAFDVHLLSADAGGPLATDVGEVVVTERAPRRPATARVLIGRETSAGEVLHLHEPALRRAFARAGSAAIRIRTMLGPIEADASGGREVLVRLGVFGGTPISVVRVELVALDGRPFSGPSEARLCGAEADPYPISVHVVPGPRVVRYPAPGEPGLAVRHAGDDLCVRYVLAP